MSNVIPTMEMVGPGGRVVVNVCDEDTYRERGYVTLAETETPEYKAREEEKTAAAAEVAARQRETAIAAAEAEASAQAALLSKQVARSAATKK